MGFQPRNRSLGVATEFICLERADLSLMTFKHILPRLKAIRLLGKFAHDLRALGDPFRRPFAVRSVDQRLRVRRNPSRAFMPSTQDFGMSKEKPDNAEKDCCTS